MLTRSYNCLWPIINEHLQSMRLLGKLILGFTFIWLLISVYAVFWPSVTANIIDKDYFSLRQNGYSGVSKPGTANFKGSSTSISVISYSYAVNGVFFSGTGRIDVGNKTSLKVYYCPLYPGFSLTENSVPLSWLLLLGVFGFCMLEMNKWLQGLLKKRWHNGGN